MREEILLVIISGLVGGVFTLLGIIAKTLFGMRDSVRDLLGSSKQHGTDIERHGVIISRHDTAITRIEERIKLRSSDRDYDHSQVPS